MTKRHFGTIAQPGTVLLTGALGTLGRAQAERLLHAGARIVLLDQREQHEGDAWIGQLDASFQHEARYVCCDLNQIEHARDCVRQLAQQTGGFSVLINNAALIINQPIDSITLAAYEEQIRVNSSAAFALVQAIAPDMKRRGYGKIINFCSITLNGRWEGYAPYVASKGALLGLTKALARELGPHGIRVNAISPGAVVSEAEQRVFGDRLEAYEQWVLDHQSIKARIQPDDIANVILFLAATESDMISGQNIFVDGGW